MTRYGQIKSFIKNYPVGQASACQFNCRKVIVAFSGGIDSFFVLKAAIDALGTENVLAITGDSPSLKESEKKQTSRLAESLGAQHKIISTEEMQNPNYFNNTENRCFFCKDELYSKLYQLKNDLQYDAILDGTNYDDLSDYRPGYQASKNHGIISPLAELKFTKDEIRKLSKKLGLEIWDKPSSPCLSSRIPYGQQVTKEKLSMIEQAEKIISELGFIEFRVRHFEFPSNGKTIKLAKIDIAKGEFDKIFNWSSFDKINSEFKKICYDYITIDLAGLRSGSLNVKINLPEKIKN